MVSGFPRDKIAAENNIGAGTVSSIVANYFDSIRQLAIEARQHGLNLCELALHFRLYDYFITSGASENAIESFIAYCISITRDIQWIRCLNISVDFHVP